MCRREMKAPANPDSYSAAEACRRSLFYPGSLRNNVAVQHVHPKRDEDRTEEEGYCVLLLASLCIGVLASAYSVLLCVSAAHMHLIALVHMISQRERLRLRPAEACGVVLLSICQAGSLEAEERHARTPGPQPPMAYLALSVSKACRMLRFQRPQQALMRP